MLFLVNAAHFSGLWFCYYGNNMKDRGSFSGASWEFRRQVTLTAKSSSAAMLTPTV